MAKANIVITELKKLMKTYLEYTPGDFLSTDGTIDVANLVQVVTLRLQNDHDSNTAEFVREGEAVILDCAEQVARAFERKHAGEQMHREAGELVTVRVTPKTSDVAPVAVIVPKSATKWDTISWGFGTLQSQLMQLGMGLDASVNQERIKTILQEVSLARTHFEDTWNHALSNDD